MIKFKINNIKVNITEQGVVVEYKENKVKKLIKKIKKTVKAK